MTGNLPPSVPRPYDALTTENDLHRYERDNLERSSQTQFALLYGAQNQQHSFSDFMQERRAARETGYCRLWLRTRLIEQSSLELSWNLERAFRVSKAAMAASKGRYFTRTDKSGRTQYFVWAPKHINRGRHSLRYCAASFAGEAQWAINKVMELEKGNEKIRKMARQLSAIRRASLELDRLVTEFYHERVPADQQLQRWPLAASTAAKNTTPATENNK